MTLNLLSRQRKHILKLLLFPKCIKRNIQLKVSEQTGVQYAEIKLGVKYQLWILVSIIKPFCIGNI